MSELKGVRRHVLDFDFQKVCKVTLDKNNVFGCLSCGGYFKGKGPSTPAFQHSVQYSHRLFLCLAKARVFLLPQNIEVCCKELQDVQFNLNPTFTREDLKHLYEYGVRHSVQGRAYVPGVVGLNDLRGTDYANAVLHLLNCVGPLREFLLLTPALPHRLFNELANLFRKMWNWRQFKGVVSPHEFMQAVTECSARKFTLAQRGDPIDFFVWLIDHLDRAKSGFRVSRLFRGRLRTSFVRGIANSASYEANGSKVEEKAFTLLRLEFPERGVFNRVENEVELGDLLQDYSGERGRTQGEGLRYMQVMDWPPYLVLAFKRFHTNQFKREKDSTCVRYSSQMQWRGRTYRLIAQICHEGSFQEGSFSAYALHANKWFHTHNLDVQETILPQMLLSQPTLQLYQGK